MTHSRHILFRLALAVTLCAGLSGCEFLDKTFAQGEGKAAEQKKSGKIQYPLLAKGVVKHVGAHNFIMEDLETDKYMFVEIIDEDKAVLSRIKAGQKLKLYGTEVVTKSKGGGKSVSSDIEQIELPDGTVFDMTR